MRNKLKDKIGPLPTTLDAATRLRAERLVASLNEDHSGLIGEHIVEVQALALAPASLDSDSERRTELFEHVHRLWGDATSLGHPLLGRIAASLCLVLGGETPIGARESDIVNHHVAALASLWDARDRPGRVALELVESLEESTRPYKSSEIHAPKDR
jgi:hypothetical protein